MREGRSLDALVVFDVRAPRPRAPLCDVSAGRVVTAPGFEVDAPGLAPGALHVFGDVLVLWLDPHRAMSAHERALIARCAQLTPTHAQIALLARLTLGGVWRDAARQALWCWRGGTGAMPWRLYQPMEGCWWLVTGADALVSRGVTTPDASRLRQFICGEEGAGEQDYLEGVRRILPAQCVCITAAGHRTYKLDVPGSGRSSGHVLDAIEEALARIEGGAQRPLHLSAGLDSATLLALGATDTASMSFPEEPISDEGPAITALLAPRAATHLMVPMSPWREAWDDGLFAQALDLGPRAHPGEQYERQFCRAVATLCGQQLHLSGHGADQLLWTTRELALDARWREGRVAELIALWAAPALRPALLRSGRRAAAQVLLSAEAQRLLRALLVSWRARRAQPSPWWSGAGWVIGRSSPLEAAPGLDGWGWEQLQRGLVRRHMQSGVQMGSPFLDLALWDEAAGWGASSRMGPAQGRGARLWDKLLLREALARRGALPEAVIWRPKLTTFDAVIARVLAAPLRAMAQEVERGGSRLAAMGVVDQAALGAALGRYLEAPRGAAVWRTFAAERWVCALERAPRRYD
jgi:hypothetical protein